jgi:predicted RNase H-like HicB family nuclease
MKYNLAIIIEKDADGYFAYAPDLQGCYTQGDTFEEALRNIREVIELHIEDRLASGEEVPPQSQISITTIEVSISAEATTIER